MQKKENHWSNYYQLNFVIGLALSLYLVLCAFEYKQEPEIALMIDFPPMTCGGCLELPPSSFCTKPPKYQQQEPNIIIVSNADSSFFEGDLSQYFPEWTRTTKILPPIEVFYEENEPQHIFYQLVDENTQPIKGFKALHQYIKQELHYPKQAKQMNIEGRVFLSFLVDTTGQVQHIKVIRGIGGGCDEEAIRVFKKSPRWKPARHEGELVVQKMIFPIHFKLPNKKNITPDDQ